MKYLLVLIFLIESTNTGFSQKDTVKAYKAISGTVHLMVKGKYKGMDTIFQGSGFIINGLYVVTCYHVYKDVEWEPSEAKVFFNYNLKTNPYTYDSVYATLDYQTDNSQYDFREHQYTESVRETDIIVLKLLKRVNVITSPIDSSTINKNDLLITLKFSHHGNSKRVDTRMSMQNAFGQFGSVSDYNRATQTYSIGNAQDGYSGSPVFNKKGEITGIITAGLSPKETIDVILEMFASGKLAKKEVNEILKGLEKYPTYRFAFSTNIGFLVSKYLKGYL